MGKGKWANAGAIMAAMKDTTPELAKTVSEYLTKKTQYSYDLMETKLKAAGYTVEQYFKSLEDNSSSREFIESYRHTAALAAQIEIIRNSTELPDIEKIRLLSEIHEREVAQQKEAAAELKQQRNDKLKAFGYIAVGIGVLASKQVGPTIVKSTKNIGNSAVKIAKSIPTKSIATKAKNNHIFSKK